MSLQGKAGLQHITPRPYLHPPITTSTHLLSNSQQHIAPLLAQTRTYQTNVELIPATATTKTSTHASPQNPTRYHLRNPNSNNLPCSTPTINKHAINSAPPYMNHSALSPTISTRPPPTRISNKAPDPPPNPKHRISHPFPKEVSIRTGNLVTGLGLSVRMGQALVGTHMVALDGNLSVGGPTSENSR